MRRVIARYVWAATFALAVTGVPDVAHAQDARYIVKFHTGRGAAGRAALNGAGARVVLSLDAQDAVAARIPERALAGLSRNPNVEYIEPDQIRTPMALSDRTLASGEIVPYGIQMVQADLVSSSNEGAKKICIIDSGYSQQHADLRDDTDASITQQATNTGSGTWDKDSCGHGTHVAGTVLATAGNSAGVVGVIPGVKLHVVKVFGNDSLEGGSCAWTYSSTLVAALNSCETAGANITSMSLGGNIKSRTEESAFNGAYNRGMLHVAAAGNAGNKTTSYPAGYASVISVGAVNANEAVASFSQFNRDVELSAPGVGVLSTVPWIDQNTLTFTDGSRISGAHIEFSADTTASGVSGQLVDGGLCESPGPWNGNVVLCQRGNNTFNEKVQNVKNAGGVAAVIYNNVASDPTCGVFAGTLGAGNSSTIPAIAVSCADGTSALGHTNDIGSSTVVSLFALPGSSYEAWDGTSMATPHVSAVAALVWSCNPTISNVSVRNTLNSTAKDKGTNGRDSYYGYGIVQAKAAATSVGGCSTSSASKY